MKAVDEELYKIGTKLRAFNIKDVHEWAQVKTRDPKAKKAPTHFVVGEKGVEHDRGDPRRFYKARLVLDGNRVFDRYGSRVTEALVHYVPASLTMIRFSEFHALTCSDGVVLDGDAESAFIQAPWEGDAMWIMLPREVQPESWNRMRDPVVQQVQSIYGSQRAGLHWGNRVRITLTKKENGWVWLRECGETSVYYRPVPGTNMVLLLIVFTDDFRTSGPRRAALSAYIELDGLFHFSEKSKKDPGGGTFAGVQRETLNAPPGFRKIRLHQTQYAMMMLEKVRERIGYRPKHKDTPAKAKLDTHDLELAAQPGVYAQEAPEWTGQLMWITRGTRPDALFATRKCATRLHDWTALEDAMVLYEFGYFEKYPGLGLVFTVHQDEVFDIKQIDFADSDLAGEEVTAKSTSGWLVLLRSVRSHAAVDFGVRRQSVTAFSTPDAETRAQADLIVRSAAVINHVLECIYRRRVEERLHSDNSACIAAIRAGHSRAMAYMRRTQKISVGLVADYCADSHTSLHYVKTGDNISDIFTKALDSVTFWRLAKLLGLE
jgi:hypothetical protein